MLSDKELTRRQKCLDRANRRLNRAVEVLLCAADDMSAANQEHYPKGACGDKVREAVAIVNQVLKHFPTASH